MADLSSWWHSRIITLTLRSRLVIAGALVLLVAAAIGSRLAFGDSAPSLWDQMQGSFGPRNVHFSPDGKVIATASADGTVNLWDAMDKHLLNGLAEGDPWAPITDMTPIWTDYSQLAFSPYGGIFAWSHDSSILFYDVHQNRLAFSPLKAAGFVCAMSIAKVPYQRFPDDNLVAAGGTTVELWRMSQGDDSGYTVGKYRNKYSAVCSVTSLNLSEDAKLLAGGFVDGMVRVWQVTPDINGYSYQAQGIMTATATIGGTGISQIAISPDDKVLAIGDGLGYIELMSIPTGRVLRQFSVANNVDSFAFSPDSKRLAAGIAKNRIDLWDVAAGTHIWDNTEVAGYATDMRFSADGKTLTIGYSNGQLSAYTLP